MGAASGAVAFAALLAWVRSCGPGEGSYEGRP